MSKILLFFIAIILILSLFPTNTNACQATSDPNRYKNSDCTGSNLYGYSSLGTTACLAKQATSVYYLSTTCSQDTLTTRWEKGSWSGLSDKDSCKAIWNLFCDDSITGVWDTDDNACVNCNFNIEIRRDYCGGSDSGGGDCEYSCGASFDCDERDPDTTGGMGIHTDSLCDSNCQHYKCDPSNCGKTVSVWLPAASQWEDVICVYNPPCVPCSQPWSWVWKDWETPSDFCCDDNYCSDYVPDTAQNFKYHKYVCECEKYPSKCSIDGSSYRCKIKEYCESNSDCNPPVSCCGSWQAGGPGGDIQGLCVKIPTNKDAYLCTTGSPASWYECDENSVGVTKEVGSDKYVCSVEDGKYLWVIQNVQGTEPSIISLIVKIFQKIFFFI